MPKGHKDDCLCSICQQKRKKVVAAPVAVSPPAPTIAPPPPAPVVVPPPPPPTTVRLDSLDNITYFELRGERHMVKEKVEGMVVCCNLSTGNVMTLAGFTKVKPIE